MKIKVQAPEGNATRKPSVNLKALAYQMERLAQLEAKIKGGPPDAGLLQTAKLTANGIFRLVVMGEIKKGKSSFINALLGTADLVPVHSDVSTSTIYKIHYGPDIKYTVYFEKKTGKDNLVIQPGEINEYGTEDGNPGNIKRVDNIRVESPSPLLKNGLIIVDTPGVGGLFKEHREITFRHAPNADAVFFMTESDGAPIGEDEVKFLKELRQITSLISFAQTRSSKAELPARKARMENNLSILREQVGIPDEDIRYFIVDSNLKLKADALRASKLLDLSGFGPLMAYLNDSLRRNQEINVARSALGKTITRLIPLQEDLVGRKRLLEADTSEKRAELDKELKEFQGRLLGWEKTSKPHIQEQFRKGMNYLTHQSQEFLSPLQPGGGIYSEFGQLIWQAENAEQLKVLLAQVQNDLAALTSSACIKTCEYTKAEALKLLETLTFDIAKSMSEKPDHEITLSNIDANNLFVNTSAIDRIVNKQMDGSFFDEARIGLYGGMAGVAMASIVGGLIGSVIPIVGTIAGSWVGMAIAGAWGGHKAVELDTSRKLESLKQQCDNALQQALSSAYQSATKQVTKLITDIQSEASSRLQKILVQANDDLVQKRNELSQRQMTTHQELKQSQSAVANWSAELDGIQKSLTAFRATLPV